MKSVFETIQQYHQKWPVDIRAIADALGLTIHEVGMPDDISGILVRVAGKCYIKVNVGHHENRKRFTIAHEIAHYILHADLFDSEIVDDKFYRSPQISSMYESQANAYAAELLMPRHLIVSCYDELKKSGAKSIIPRMAVDFGVSQQAMTIRLDNVRQVEMNIA